MKLVVRARLGFVVVADLGVQFVLVDFPDLLVRLWPMGRLRRRRMMMRQNIFFSQLVCCQIVVLM